MRYSDAALSSIATALANPAFEYGPAKARSAARTATSRTSETTPAGSSSPGMRARTCPGCDAEPSPAAARKSSLAFSMVARISWPLLCSGSAFSRECAFLLKSETMWGEPSRSRHTFSTVAHARSAAKLEFTTLMRVVRATSCATYGASGRRSEDRRPSALVSGSSEWLPMLPATTW